MAKSRYGTFSSLYMWSKHSWFLGLLRLKEPRIMWKISISTFAHSFLPIERLRVSVQKNKKLSGKFQNFKIVQTLAISGPYWTTHRCVVHLSSGVLFAADNDDARFWGQELKNYSQKLGFFKLAACRNYNPRRLPVASSLFYNFFRFYFTIPMIFEKQ